MMVDGDGGVDPDGPGGDAGSCTAGMRLGASFHTSCAIDGAGALFCWGDNSRGQLGLGHTEARWTPTRLDIAPVREVVGGETHACALAEDGSVWCWGDGGRLGDGTTTDGLSPVRVLNVEGAVQIAAGDAHTCARTANHEVWCWGDGGAGQLGEGMTANRTEPVRAMLPAEGVIDLGAGGDTTCAILETTGLMCWGGGKSGQIGDGAFLDRDLPVSVPVAGARRVKGGDLFTCALDGSGTLWCMGDNGSAQLGDGTLTDRSMPTLSAEGVDDFSCGIDHICVLSGGAVRCWGDDSEGEDGDESLNDLVHAPGTTVALSGPAVAISAGGDHTCAVLEDDRVMCWGNDAVGELGDGTPAHSNAPVEVVGVTGATGIAAGFRHTCAVAGSRVYCWGSNLSGQCGVEPDVAALVAEPNMGPDGDVQAVGLGQAHSCIIQGAARNVRCWGRNTDGQLGNNTRNSSHTPVTAMGVTDVEGIGIGWEHSCILDGTAVRCWGDNDDGQIGNGNRPNDALVAVTVSGSFTDLGGGGRGHTCARNGGTVSCWGLNSDGQLGLGNFTDRDTPGVTTLSTASDISLGSSHSCADAGSSGDVYCWGQNQHGQLGLADLGDENRPTANGAGAISALSTGGDFTCFVREVSGEVACMGRNQWGQLGPAPGMDRAATHVPVTVPLPDAATRIAAGNGHVCALLVGGRVFCWGLDVFAQLGGGATPTFGPREAVVPGCN